MKKILLLLLLLPFAAEAQQKIVWPKHKKAVIVLTYDDALTSQLNIAVPQLDSARFKATFFLTGNINFQTIPQWRRLAKNGYELGNHTLYHPCAGTEDNPVSSRHYTPHGIIREIDMMNHLLYAVDGLTGRTYAYPCTETSVGGKDYVDTLRKYGLVKYARIGGDSNAVITDFAHLDPLKVPSYGLDPGTPADKLIDFAKKVEDSGGMGIFMFHGVGGDYLTTSAEAHRALLAWLKAHKKEIWVATFQQAMDYVNSHK
ncbi:MAG: polysaccharide deacetylase family protein [Bacteroidetes bacterium]|nr:polysaccharide deacetylase family protein [Bacteroidota bacterium]